MGRSQTSTHDNARQGIPEPPRRHHQRDLQPSGHGSPEILLANRQGVVLLSKTVHPPNAIHHFSVCACCVIRHFRSLEQIPGVTGLGQTRSSPTHPPPFDRLSPRPNLHTRSGTPYPTPPHPHEPQELQDPLVECPFIYPKDGRILQGVSGDLGIPGT